MRKKINHTQQVTHYSVTQLTRNSDLKSSTERLVGDLPRTVSPLFPWVDFHFKKSKSVVT